MKKKHLLSLLIIISSYCYGQKEVQRNYFIKKTIKDSLYSGKVILYEHSRAKLYLRLSDYLEREKYQITEIKFNNNTIGDFNKNGIPDFFVTMNIKQRSRNETYLCLVELNNYIVSIYSYFEMGSYSKLIIESSKSDTLNVRTQMWGTNGKHFLDRVVSIIHDKNNIVKIVTPSKIDEMKNLNIFKDTLKKIKRESFINNNIIKEQYEVYTKDNLYINAGLTGFNDFVLRFTVIKRNIDSNFNKAKFTSEIFEFLESNTRFPSILTRIEKNVMDKNEDKIAISDKLKYDIKNFINSNTYFVIGEHQSTDYLFDLLYIEETPNKKR